MAMGSHAVHARKLLRFTLKFTNIFLGVNLVVKEGKCL